MTPTIRNKLIYFVAIALTLVLITYLPIFIWSPPQGESGYYQNYEATKFSIFNKGIYTRLFDRHNPHIEKDIVFTKTAEGWVGSEYSTWAAPLRIKGQKYRINFVNDELYFNKYERGNGTQQTRLIAILHKVHNPFTLWHIKWLEWTAE